MESESTTLTTTHGDNDSAASNILSVIQRAAADPAVNVEKMNALLDLQLKVMDRQAEMEFNDAMNRLQPKLPVIRKNSQIIHNNKRISSYAKYEDIDAIIRPLYIAEGFSISFDSKRTPEGVTYYGRLSHSGGHYRTAELVLPPDTGGAKNGVQAVGSTVSYARRYLVGMLLNLVTADEDDDGAGGPVEKITHDQVVAIECLIDEAKADRPRFLSYMGVAHVAEITVKDYDRAVNMLENKKRQGGSRP